MRFGSWLQSRLTAHGFPVGMIDGHIGPVTTAAIEAFQKLKSLSVTGTATEETITALRQSSTSSAPSMPEREEAPSCFPKQKDVGAFYGKPGERQTRIILPYPMKLAWNKSQTVTKMTLHERVADSAQEAFQEVADTYSMDEIQSLGLDLFGGSLNVRRMRGGTKFSMHSWGIAIDFDPERNGLRTRAPHARLSHSDALPFWQAWEKRGWVSLGRARNFDWMHVQAATL